MDELRACLKLIRLPGLSAASLHDIVAALGSLSAIHEASSRALLETGFSPSAVERLRALDDASIKPDLDWLAQPGHHFLHIGSELYPALLRQVPDAPLGLFVSGDPACLSEPQLAMVGSRNPSAGGRATAEEFARHLAGCGLTVTSGLATGIDAASHRGALAGGGKTIAVCGTGLDRVYPSSSAALARQIEACGALVSEFPPGTPPHRRNFPQRNRIISGLALGTLVVEAALHSGSLITATLAGEQGREVFAIPGSIHNHMAKGCHQLIRQGAKLIDSTADILAELGPLTAALASPESTDRARVSGPRLDKAYKMLLDALGFEPAGVDLLVSRTGLKADEVASMLLILELEGHIESFPGGLYERVQPEATK